HIYFTTHTLGTDEKYEIYYDILSKAHHDADFKLDHFVTRSANQATLLSDPQFLPIQHSPIPYPGYTSIHVSDILDDYDGGGGPGILSPPAPIPPESNDAFNTPVSLFIENELIADLPDYGLLGKYPTSPKEDILVGPGGRITVASGASLLIKDMYMRSCDTMW